MNPKKELLEESMSRLGWAELKELLARFAYSASGAKSCRHLTPFSDFESANSASLASEEMSLLVQADPPFPSLSFGDLPPLLAKARRDIPLEPKELKTILTFLKVTESVTRYFSKRTRNSIPNLIPLADSLKDAPGLARDISTIIDDEGQIRPNASPELARLNREAERLRRALSKKMEAILDSSRYGPNLQDRYFTEREGRYVIPIRTETRNVCPGIVHGISGSGATLFLEPEPLVDLNNKLKIAEMSIDRESLRLLRDTARRVAGSAAPIASNFQVLTRLDLIQAGVRFGISLEASYPKLKKSGRFLLRGAKHPVLLAGKKDQVIGNTIETDDGIYGVVISGPNTGGKTVALKMIGILSLMAASGLPLTVAPGSKLPFFPEVYADIGDEQDILRELSTFSAHMKNIIRVMKEARPGALVLLDELMVSTEPKEGAALAEAIIMEFVDKRIPVVVTTHYNSLKAMAQTRPDLLNMGFGFDLEKMSPTYRLTLGAPERSSPMEIALRLGMDKELFERSAILLREGDARLETILSEIQREKTGLAKEAATARGLRMEAEEVAREQRRMEGELKKELDAFHKEKRKRLKGEVSAAKQEIRETIKALKARPDRAMAGRAESRLDDMVRPPAPPPAPAGLVPLESLKPGDVVEIPRLQARGELLEEVKGKKSVKVRIGNFESRVTVSNLRGLVRKRGTGPKKKKSALVAINLEAGYAPSSSDVCDIRGLTGDEAVAKLAGFIDGVVLSDLPMARIIHGMGTGALKARVLRFLKEFPFPLDFRPALPNEGGGGVTIVELTPNRPV